MSLIACVSDCVYQQDGFCSLERAASCGEPAGDNACVNYVPRKARPSSQFAPPASPPDLF